MGDWGLCRPRGRLLRRCRWPRPCARPHPPTLPPWAPGTFHSFRAPAGGSPGRARVWARVCSSVGPGERGELPVGAAWPGRRGAPRPAPVALAGAAERTLGPDAALGHGAGAGRGDRPAALFFPGRDREGRGTGKCPRVPSARPLCGGQPGSRAPETLPALTKGLAVPQPCHPLGASLALLPPAQPLPPAARGPPGSLRCPLNAWVGVLWRSSQGAGSTAGCTATHCSGGEEGCGPENGEWQGIKDTAWSGVPGGPSREGSLVRR